jgi:small nuclear ribonucleoprotein
MGMSTSEPVMKMLEESLGKNVLIRLRGGGGIRGILAGYDIHLNLVLSDAVELKGDETQKLGQIVVRGDNVILISPSQPMAVGGEKRG